MRSPWTASSFTFIKRLFSVLLFAIRVVLSAYMSLLIFLPAILIPVCASSSLPFHLMYSAYKLPRRRKWEPTAVFLPGEPQGRGCPAGYRLRGRTDSDTMDWVPGSCSPEANLPLTPTWPKVGEVGSLRSSGSSGGQQGRNTS